MIADQSQRPVVAMIVAMNRRRVIGVDNRLPWHLPEDLKHFKRLTMGKPIVMGRKTWESIGRPLPGRTNIVISRNATLRLEGALVANSAEQALALAIEDGLRVGADEVFVIGGENVYRQLLEQADRLYLTEVDNAIDGDAHFPELESTLWSETARDCYPEIAGERPAFCFVTLRRKRQI